MIWNLEKAFCIYNIFTTGLVFKFELFSNYLYYRERGNNIILYDNKNLEVIKNKHFESYIIDFTVIKEKEIIILYENSILIYMLLIRIISYFSVIK